MSEFYLFCLGGSEPITAARPGYLDSYTLGGVF